MLPRATYRVQLTPELHFDALRDRVGYFRRLGVSHLYLSPILQAAPGSRHGYDVVDHTQISEALGGEAAYLRLCRTLAEAGLSQVVDLVPNHMAIGTPGNRWWWDVLENGPASRFASYFDVDWGAHGAADDRVLLPVLGDHSGRALEARELRVELTEPGKFVVRYHDHTFPAAPRSLGDLLRAAADRADSEDLAFLAAAFERLPDLFAKDRQGSRSRHQEQVVLHRLMAGALQVPSQKEALLAEIELLNDDIDRLDAFLERQNFRLRYWRTGRQELEYRRFFDIDTLVSLRMEDPEVFEDTHRRVLELVDAGDVTGLRIDHIDGLRDPRGYLTMLKQRAPTAWTVVEKILEHDERLPENWACAGTTGYDFMRQVTGVLLDPDGLDKLSAAARAFLGHTQDFDQIVAECKASVLQDGLQADITRLVSLASLVTESHRRHRDHSKATLRELIEAFVVRFPVYRTYVSPRDSAPSMADRAVVDRVAARVKRELPELDPELVEWFADVLLLRFEGDLEEELALRFQQLTGPAMAKGVEDTAMYRHVRLLAANDVGGQPADPAVSLDQFHGFLAEASHRTPMLTTSTHDTKRSEDVRARLAVLSEDPDEWGRCAALWRERCRIHGGDDVDPETLYAIFQTWVGAWPIDEGRLTAYFEKFGREAKTHTSWTRQDARYEKRVRTLIQRMLEDTELVHSVESYVKRIAPAGKLNGLTQTLVKLTAPGVPDIYQGCELFSWSLVDPDNRRPVDFDLRERLLDELPAWEPGLSPRTEVADALAADWDSGRTKLWVVATALAVRTHDPEAFEGGAARIGVDGPGAGRLIAFSRSDRIVTVAPRRTLDAPAWNATRVELPAGAWRNAFDGILHEEPPEVESLLRHFPVALLVREAG